MFVNLLVNEFMNDFKKSPLKNNLFHHPVKFCWFIFGALISCIVSNCKFLKFLKINQGLENPANSVYWLLIFILHSLLFKITAEPADNLQYLFLAKIWIQTGTVFLNLAITVLFNLNYRLIELNNEFGIDSYQFFWLKNNNDVVMFSLSSSQIGGIILLA